MWLSTAHRPMGGLKPTGVSQMLARRGKIAGVDVRAHAFRRRLASQWLLLGGSKSGLMSNCGWTTTEMVRRYGESSLEASAIAESRRLFRSASRLTPRRAR